MVRADFFTSLVLIAFGLGVFAEALRMPRYENLGVNPYTAPGVVPGILGLTLTLFGLIMLVRAWRQRAAGVAAQPADTSGRRLLLTIGVTLGYGAVLVGWLPFWLATFVFVSGFILLFELREPERRRTVTRIVLLALVEGALVAAAVTFVFERIFLVRLP